MRRYLNLLIGLYLVISITSCGPSNSVNITKFSPQNEVELLTTFVVEFDKPLAPKDTLNKWSDVEYMKFSPSIAGKFRWTDESTLQFSPDLPLEPIQDYKAEISKKVLFGKNYSSDFDEYKFHTQDFDVIKAEIFWTQIPGGDHRISIQANIFFNYPVLPDMLNNFLEIKNNDVKIDDYQIVSTDASKVIALNLGEIIQTERSQELSIKVKSGLESIFGKKPLADSREFEEELPEITRLAVKSVAAGFDGANGWINVFTTQPVDQKYLKDFVSVKQGKNLNFFSNENSFRIEGNFENFRQVNLEIKKGLPGLYGGTLEFDYAQVVSLVNLRPSISFSNPNSKYLMISGEKNIDVRTVNVDEVEVTVSKIFENNLAHFLNQYDYYYGDYNYGSHYYYTGTFGKELYSEKIKLDSPENWLQNLTINLDKALSYERFNGIFITTVRSNESRWISDSKMIAISDLGIIAKKYKNGFTVFINSIATTQPIANVKVNLRSSDNQIILSGGTNEAGIVEFKNAENELKGFTPRLITAQKDGDFNYIDLNETRIETSRFDVGGRGAYSQDFSTFLYGDRNIYRPGEKVNISAIIRDDNFGVVEGVPVILKIISPTGKIFNQFNEILNDEGSFETSFVLPEFVQTGNYYAEVYSGSELLIGSYQFSVEEFVPDKIRVSLETNKKIIEKGEEVKIGVESEFLFGAKASGLKYEAEFQFKHKSYRSKKYSDYDFSNSSSPDYHIENIDMNGALDEEGKAELSYIAPLDIRSPGIVAAFAYVSVFDLTGRTVNRLAQFDIYPNDYFIGVKTNGYYFGTNENILIKAAAVDKNDEPLRNFPASIKLVRYEWQTVLKKDYSNKYYYDSEKKEITVWERDYIFENGVGEITVNEPESGEYELRISRKGAAGYQRAGFYLFGWGSTSASSFEVNKEGRVEIIPDKEIYEPGESAKLLFSTPFSGKMLVCFERSGVLDHQFVNVQGRSAEIEITVKEEYLPNVYVTATLFKAHSLESDTPFLVGHGFKSIKVDKKNYRLPVTITAPEKIKPRREVEVNISTLPKENVYITLAAVDEGILQIKDYATPDPYSFMYAKRELRVENYDLYKLLLPEIVTEKSSSGGDALAGQLKKRINPFTAKRFKLLSFWSGIRKTDSHGRVSVNFVIPQYNGSVRLMAVAYSGKQFGSASKEMKVSDDLIIQYEIPRFLSAGDSLTGRITILNTTDDRIGTTLSTKVEGPISLKSGGENQLTIEPKSRASAQYSFKCGEEPGIGKIFYSLKERGITEEIEISVRPNTPFVVESGSGSVEAGKQAELNLPDDFIEGARTALLTISKFPAVTLSDQLKRLIGYPYGCIEQTVSKLFPQIYFEELAKLAAPNIYRDGNPVYFVREGIKKIESMQLYDGSIAYWQGGSYSNWWGGVYALHFLIEAKKAGYNVDSSTLEKLLQYVAHRVKDKETYDYITYEENVRVHRTVAKKEILYSLYALALAGKGDISLMNYYKARMHLLSRDAKYLLAGAFGLMGQWNSYRETLPGEFQPERTIRQTGGNFDSEVRANAIMLNVLLEVDPDNAQIPFMIRHLSKLKDQFYSTQERAFAFLALGKAAKLNADADVRLTVSDGSNNLGKFTGKDKIFKPESNLIKLTAEGKGSVYYFWSVEGIKKGGKIKEEDLNMKVRRSFYNYETHTRITNGRFKQGELVLCKISVAGFARSAENIAVTDLIPAGFEIENPRLNEPRDLGIEPKNLLTPDYVDIRDDRIILFTSLVRNKTQNYYYLVRVVNRGGFVLPPVGSEAMYDPEFHSYNGGGKIFVTD